MGEFTVVGLRVVREAARCGSFSTAAENLGYTQSAVSRQIALMEQAAGRALFERHARGVRATAAGRIVLRHADTVLGGLGAARQELDELSAHPPATLRVGAFSTAMAALVPRAIAATAPRLARVPLREGTSPRLATAVARGRLDLAVVTGMRNPLPDTEIHPLLDDPLLVAVPPDHHLAGRTSVTPVQLRGERWIAGSTEVNTTLLGAWRDAAAEPEIALVARDWVAKLGLVVAGMGSTVVPGIAVPVLPPGLALIRIDHPDAVRPTSVLHRGGDPAAPRELFLEALRDTAADLAAEVRQRLR
ncbi:LysR family transcriptional regulator [Nocardia blacklockiae]|uniref:LysR family transcriptional regulator n=1 Tax=Nocardia blacklockiae TaxID=480036 RepID=UPI001894EB47|nr:LysR family transcriptional regulator [Nocardia blacklockiae]MBF6170041.1 LysR family transcriptional regulator [Nocardia blacklockiae]